MRRPVQTPIESLLQYRFATPKLLKTCRGPGCCETAPLCNLSGVRLPLPLALHCGGSVLAVKGSLRRFAPGTAAGRSGETRCSRGKRGISGRADAPKGTFRPYQPLEPQPRGAVTRRAVAQRRSRASGLTRLSAAAIRGFWVGFCCRPVSPRSAAVWRKSFVFRFLPIRKVLVLSFAGGVSPPLALVSLLFSVSYPQDRCSYYLFFNYLFFNYLSVRVNSRRPSHLSEGE